MLVIYCRGESGRSQLQQKHQVTGGGRLHRAGPCFDGRPRLLDRIGGADGAKPASLPTGSGNLSETMFHGGGTGLAWCSNSRQADRTGAALFVRQRRTGGRLRCSCWANRDTLSPKSCHSLM
jgi:hypothetical protein